MELVGAHVETKGTPFKTIQNAYDNLDMDVIQIFVSSPKNFSIPQPKPAELAKIKEYVKKNKIKLFAHAKYMINLSQPTKFPASLYRQELQIIVDMGGITAVVHTGKALKQPYEVAFNNMVNNIKYVLFRLKDIPVCIETPAGAGTEILTTTEEMARFYNAFHKDEKKRITFCIDTCHIFVAGYDIRTKKGMKDYLAKWNKLIGLRKVACIQLNDSKAPLNSKRDRHETVGEGFIGSPEFEGSPYGFIELFRVAEKLKLPLIIERCGKPIKLQMEEVEKIKEIMNKISSK